MSFEIPVLASNRWLRYLVFLAYYSMQGLPLGLIMISIPTWLIAKEVPVGLIATFASVTALPWALKMIAGPFMDRFSFLPMGMRRPWILGTQVLMLLSVLMFFLIKDPIQQFWLMTGTCTLINGLAATEDVAVDGLAIAIIPENERGRANAFMGAGQAFGMSIAGWISISLLNLGGFPAAALHMIGALAVLIVITILFRERAGERFLPWTKGEANPNAIEPEKSVLALFKDLIRLSFLPMTLLLMLVVLFQRVNFGIYTIWKAELGITVYGYTDEQVAQWRAIILLVTAGMGLAAGPLVDKMGAPRAHRYFLLFGGLVFICLYPFVDAIANPKGAILFLFLCEFGMVLLFISFIAACMSICSVRIASTQFACFMAFGNLGMSLGSAIYPTVSKLTGLNGIFLFLSATYILTFLIMTRFNLESHKQRLAKLEA